MQKKMKFGTLSDFNFVLLQCVVHLTIRMDNECKENIHAQDGDVLYS